MILVPAYFNSTSLQSTDYESYIPRASADLQVQTQLSYTRRAGAVPVYTGKDWTPHALTLNIKCLHDHTTLFESINQLFNVFDETPRQFICTDSEDSNKQYYVYATPRQVQGGNEGQMVTVILGLDDPVWQSVTQNSQTFAITSATDSTGVAAGGNADSYPIFEITPTSSPTTDFIYSVGLQILPRSENPWTNRPLLITGSSDTTFDTAALIAAGKMQSNGEDLRVYRDNVLQNYWTSGMNTTDTKVWVVADMPEARNMTLKTAIGATDTVTEIEIDYTDANLTAFDAMSATGRLIVDASIGSTDTEEFAYSAKTKTDTKLAFTIAARAFRTTTATAHAAGANVRNHPYAFRLSYGNATASAPTIDNTTQPIIDLTNSSNASFVYSSFFDTAGLRAGRWHPAIRSQSDPLFSRSTWFTSTNDAGDTDPASEMGLKALTYESGGLWRPDSFSMSWTNQFPDYVTSFSASGDQTQSTSSWPSVGMGYLGASRTTSQSGFNFFWTVSAQSATDYGTWTTWSKATSDAALPAELNHLYWQMEGSILGSTDVYAKAGASAVTVNLTNPPHVMIRSESSSTVKINCTIRNETTGESFDLTIPVEVNETVTIDTDPSFPYCKYSGEISNSAVKLSTFRAAWLRLQPGANTVGFENSQSVASNFNVVIKWRDRANYF